MEVEDWLQDPLRKIESGSYKSRKLKSPNDKQNDLWQSYHFTTRLKLDAADHFCRQVLGAASIPYDLGLPLLAHRQLLWYLDAFFLELMSAYDTLLQELNIVYACDSGFTPKQVRLDNNKFRDRLPDELLKYMDEEWEKDWFRNISRYRNMAAHQRHVPTGAITGWIGNICNWDYHEVSLYYLDDKGELKEEKIKACPRYLKMIVKHIQQVWQEMAQEFD